MESKTMKILFNGFFFVTLLFSFTHPSSSQEVEDESEFSYEEGSPTGPSNWGQLRPEWINCSIGKMQSPINLVNAQAQVVPFFGVLQNNYTAARATLRNRGHDIMVRWEGGAGFIEINGTRYQLNQLHWHSPSEHTIDGMRYDLEAHLVHQSSTGRTAVIGILYQFGPPNLFLSSITPDLIALANSTEESRDIGTRDPRLLVELNSRTFYQYNGSLTTPPCSEDVVWTIVGMVGTVSRGQVKLLRDCVHDGSGSNARPIQPTNGRIVKLFKPTIFGYASVN